MNSVFLPIEFLMVMDGAGNKKIWKKSLKIIG